MSHQPTGLLTEKNHMNDNGLVCRRSHSDKTGEVLGVLSDEVRDFKEGS